METFLDEKIESGVIPGGHVLVAHGETIVADHFSGSKLRGSQEAGDRATSDTLYNLESMTKVIVTLPLAFKLIEEGRLRLDDAIVSFIPEFGTNEVKERVTVRHLMSFTGGTPKTDPPGSEKAAREGNIERAWQLHYLQGLKSPPGTRVIYSDSASRILGRVLEIAADTDLATAAKARLFDPLGMVNTTFVPTEAKRCAATVDEHSGEPIQGRISQELERLLGGVLGSDGLFSTAGDLLVFSRMLLNGGEVDGVRVLSTASVDRMIGESTTVGINSKPRSYLDYLVFGPKVWMWEAAASPYSYFGDLVSDAAVGKLGGAGTYLLIDPLYDLVVIYLTNYGQPAGLLDDERTWNSFHRELDMMALCNAVIADF